MTDNIVDLQQKRLEASPHKSGRVRCGACKHEWVAVVPAEAEEGFECPNCGSMRGMWNHPFAAQEGDAVLVCQSCGHDGWLIAVKKSGKQYTVCKSCGTVGNWPI